MQTAFRFNYYCHAIQGHGHLLLGWVFVAGAVLCEWMSRLTCMWIHCGPSIHPLTSTPSLPSSLSHMHCSDLRVDSQRQRHPSGGVCVSSEMVFELEGVELGADGKARALWPAKLGRQ